MSLRSWIKRKLRSYGPFWLWEMVSKDRAQDVAIIRGSGRFDEDYYRALYPEVSVQHPDLVRHYCSAGWRLGFNPSDDFDTNFYLATYPDIREGGINPFVHYIQNGAAELRLATPSLGNSYEEDVWFGDCSSDVQLIAFYQEPDWSCFRHDRQSPLHHHQEALVPLQGQGVPEAADSRLLQRQAHLASSHGFHGFCFEVEACTLDPERPMAWQVFRDTPTIPLAYCLKLHLPAEPEVGLLWAEVALTLIDPRGIRIQGRPLLLLVLPADASAFAVDALRQALKSLGAPDPYLMGCFLSAGAPPADGVVSRLDGLLDLAEHPVPCETGPFQPLPKKGYDLVPYKVVVSAGLQRLESLESSLPHRFHGLSLARSGVYPGASQPLVYSRFLLADYRRWLEAALKRLRQQPSLDHRLLFIKSWNNWIEGQVLEPDRLTGYSKLNTTTRTLLGMRQDQPLPKVSIIIPDVHRDRYLHRRLASIQEQTYRNTEVLLIGHPTSPEARNSLEAFIEANPWNTRRLFLQGGTMAEEHWSRALEAARGELIWIAKAEDDCDGSFLETLVASFEDESVLLAYASSVETESSPVVRTSHQEVNTTLGLTNPIASLSCVVFRRPESIPLLKDQNWLGMHFFGEWIFYLHIILGGKIAFHARPLTRTHPEYPAHDVLHSDYYRELGRVCKAVASLYDVPVALLEEFRATCHTTYANSLAAAANDSQFEHWFDYVGVLQARRMRQPHILVSTMGFYPGGAEILPIRLANEFKRHGLAVTLLNVGLHVSQHGVRILLRNDIPVVKTSSLEETRDLIKNFGVDVLNSHQWHVQRYPHFMPDIFADIAHVGSLHGMIEHGNVAGVTPDELANADQGVTTWIYTAEKNLAPFVENELLLHPHGRFLKLANGMEPPKQIEPIPRQQMGIPEDAFVLCCVSRAIPEKGWEETIEVVRLARERTGKDIRLILVGNGILHDQYRLEGVPEYVYLAGFHANSVGHYAAADMGVMLTRFKSESFPLTIVDCLFAGRPYLATDVGDIRNILTGADGVAGDVIPLQDWEVPIDEVVASLVRFVTDSSLYKSRKEMAARLATRYRIDVVAEQYLSIFQEDIAAVRSIEFGPEDVIKIRESELFDEEYYRALHPEVSLDKRDLIRHYCLVGWRNGFNPSDAFDTNFYLENNADIRVAGINPFLHYVLHGASELRLPKASLNSMPEDDVWFGRFRNMYGLVAFYRQPDWNRFRKDQATPYGQEEGPYPHPDFGFYDASHPSVLFRQASLAKAHGLYGFCFEADAHPNDLQRMAPWQVFREATDIAFSFCLKLQATSTPPEPSFLEEVASALRDPRAIQIDSRPVLLLSSGSHPSWVEALKRLESQPFLIGCRGDAREPIAEDQGPLDGCLAFSSQPVPLETGAFTPLRREGYEFVPYRAIVDAGLQRLRSQHPPAAPEFHCITLSRHGRTDSVSLPLVYSSFTLPDYREWLENALQQLRRQPPGARLLFLNSWNNWNEGMILEPDRFSGYSKLNTTTRCLLGMGQEHRLPKVSVIVTDCQDGLDLPGRLDSIYAQSYKNIEVILICVRKQSRHLDEFIAQHADNTRCFFADPQSPATCHWSAFLDQARGDLLWIAEPDVECDPRFLEILVSAFEDEAVLLAHSFALPIEDRNTPADVRRPASYLHTAHYAIQSTLGYENVIPTLSSVVFRRPDSLSLLRDSSWQSMRFHQEWIFYLHILAGGKIAFCSEATVYFGSLPQNGLQLEPEYYKEQGMVSRAVASLYDVPLSWLDRAKNTCLATYISSFKEAAEDSVFEEWYDHKAVLAAYKNRLPNLLVATMGFYPGGAEILPIRLANEFKRHGVAVTLLSTGLHVRQHGVYTLLRNDIPLVETASLDETKKIIRGFGIQVLNTHQWHIQKYSHLMPDIFSGIAHVACLHGMIEYGNAFCVTREQLLDADRGVTTWIYTADKNLTPFDDLKIRPSSHGRFLKLVNGMEPPIIVPILREEIGIPEDAFVLCCVSRAIPEKGWEETIEVVRRARDFTGKDLRLILVGNGFVYDQYRMLGVPDFVYLAGFSSNSVGHYAAADMGIMLTRFKSESFPLTIVDCLFAGKPYLATDVGEIRNILTGAEGVAGDVIPLQNWEVPIDEVVASLVRFVTDSSLYKSRQEMAARLANRYRIDVVAEQYLKIFQEDVAALPSRNGLQSC